MLELVGIIAPFFMVIMLGFLAGRLGFFKLDSAKVFNNYLLYFALPAMFLSKLLEQDVLSGFDVRILLIFMGANTTIIVLSWIIHGGLFRLSLGDTAALGTTSAWGNSGYMGIPLALELLGGPGIFVAFSLLAADIIIISIAGFALHEIDKDRTENGSGSAVASILRAGRKTLRSIATNPFLWPFAIGFALSAVRPYWPPYFSASVDFVFPALEMLSATAFGVALRHRCWHPRERSSLSCTPSSRRFSRRFCSIWNQPFSPPALFWQQRQQQRTRLSWPQLTASGPVKRQRRFWFPPASPFSR